MVEELLLSLLSSLFLRSHHRVIHTARLLLGEIFKDESRHHLVNIKLSSSLTEGEVREKKECLFAMRDGDGFHSMHRYLPRNSGIPFKPLSENFAKVNSKTVFNHLL